jgi:hypothetical protein
MSTKELIKEKEEPKKKIAFNAGKDLLSEVDIQELKDKAKALATNTNKKINEKKLPYKIVDIQRQIADCKKILSPTNKESPFNVDFPDESLLTYKLEYERRLAKLQKRLDHELLTWGQSLIKQGS